MAWGVGSLTVTAFPQTAVSDGIKRAVRLFGDGLGNCISDKDYLKDVKAGHYQHATRVTSFHEQAAAAATTNAPPTTTNATNAATTNTTTTNATTTNAATTNATTTNAATTTTDSATTTTSATQ